MFKKNGIFALQNGVVYKINIFFEKSELMFG